MSNNFRKTAVLKKIWFVNWYHDGPWLPASDNNLTPIAKPIIIPFIPEQKKQFQIDEHIIPFFKESVFIASCWHNVKNLLFFRHKILE